MRLVATGAGAGVVVHAAIGDAIFLFLVLCGLGALRRAIAARNIERDAATAHHAAAFLFIILIVAAAATAARHTGHAAIAAVVIGISGHVTAGAVLGKFIKLSQTLGMTARITNHTEQHLALLHIRQIISQIFIIIA